MNPPKHASTWKYRPRSAAISPSSGMGSTVPNGHVPAVPIRQIASRCAGGSAATFLSASRISRRCSSSESAEDTRAGTASVSAIMPRPSGVSVATVDHAPSSTRRGRSR